MNLRSLFPFINRLTSSAGGSAIALRTGWVESLEDRRMLASTTAVLTGAPLDVGFAAPTPIQVPLTAGATATHASTRASRPAANISLVPFEITGVRLVNGQLFADLKLGNNTRALPITVTTRPNPADATCPILNLELGPIHLDLLGLVVDTSAICVDITAHRGALLGDLLCGISNLLNQGTPLDLAFGTLTAGDQQTVLGGLGSVLNDLFGRLGNSGGLHGASCDILNLSVGPLHLNLLGLEVDLDNCNNGPVTVDITAEPGPGKLLGNLLCGLADILNDGGSQTAIDQLLGKISREIRKIISVVA
jgi:hypothetical protein